MDWGVGILTFNVAMRKASLDAVTQMITTVISRKPYVVAIGLQEVPHSEALFGVGDTWTKSIMSVMGEKEEMALIAKSSQATNVLLIFVKRKLILNIKNISYRYMKNTLGGLTGHKGSLGIRVLLKHNVCLVFVNSHFIHDSANYSKRINQYYSNKYCCFEDIDSINSHIFWFGDLNFRVDLNAEKCRSLLQLLQFEEILVNHDQLIKGMKNHELMFDFNEAAISFPPTYRYEHDSNNLDWRRIPSWCDRILFKGINISPIEYSSLTSVRVSDHKPVHGLYSLQLPDPRDLTFDVIFEHIRISYSSIPFISRFKYIGHFWESTGSFTDWIGLYDAHIEDCLSPLKWVWATTCFEQSIDNMKYYVCEFTSISKGTYRLGYFSTSKNCIVGISKSFTIIDHIQ